jgi:two-component system cell cycle sensor histidine kinase/response regulator CckA
VEGTERLLEPLISKKAAITLDLSRGLPRIEADAGQVRQVLINLATNASDAIGDRNGRITIRTGMLWAEDGDLPPIQSGHIVPAGAYVYLEVADTGSGMDAETLARIFDPFFTTKFTGRGLGLSAVMGIVRAHRGTLRVTSNVAKGTVVRVFFPVMNVRDPDLIPTPSSDSLQAQLTGTVLVVDDEEPIRMLAKTILEGAGLTVFTAADGKQAVELFNERGEHIHAVLLDLTMPGMDGAEVFRHIREVRPEVRVVLCSGYNELEVSNRVGGHRPAGFLRKPYHPRELIHLLSSTW